MATSSTFQLSTLQPLAEYLGQGLDPTAGLLDALEEALPGRGNDKVLTALAKLLDYPKGPQVLALTLAYLLDEWLRQGDKQLQRTSPQLEPFAWLATSDHLEVVQQFRQLL